MSTNFNLFRFLLKPLTALLRRITQASIAIPEEDQLDHSIISI
jgi:hypothetical protein